MNNIPIYKDNNCEITINFYKKPAILYLNCFNDQNKNISITINGDFIDGNRNILDIFIKWLSESEKELERIIWDWETGLDDLDLIETKIYF